MGKMVILFLIALVVVAPLATIYSLNILFGLTIPYTVETWLCTFWLTSIVIGTKYVKG